MIDIAKMSDAQLSLVRQVRMVGLPDPECEYRFHGERGWRFDLAWVDRRLAAEVDGGTWIAGRHNRGSGFERDAEKLNEAVIAGWRVLRFTTAMVDDGRAVTYIERAMEVPDGLG